MKRPIIFSIFFIFNLCLFANVQLPKIFTDHAVLQRNAPISIWGWADKGEKVVVTLNKQKQTTEADNSGKWQIKFNAMSAGGPYELNVKAKNVIVLKDILIGEVWLCAGQSNMAFNLSRSKNGSKEVLNANIPTIRQFKVKEKISAEPKDDVDANDWKVCSPEVAGQFSAVAYYFAKNINAELNVPVGIINSSWGGTYIEGWMSHSALMKHPDYSSLSEVTNLEIEKWTANIGDLFTYYKQQLGIQTFENYKADDAKWSLPTFDDSKWLTVPFPGNFDKSFLPLYDGVVWFRTVVDIDSQAAKDGLTLRLGTINDEYELYINGEKINTEINTFHTRQYEIDPQKLIAGKNVIAIKIINYWETGGFISPANEYCIEGKNGYKIPFADHTWKMNFASAIRVWLNSPNIQPNMLFNAMINPIKSFTIKGALWYQGENNENYAFQYKSLLPMLIADWRTQFNQGDFPFYFVQLPNFKKFNQNSQLGEAVWAEMRESFSKTLSVANTGMAVTVDLGDSTDIHPIKKEEVGKRLSFVALNNLYNKPMEFSGPRFEKLTKTDGRLIVEFEKSPFSTLIIKDIYGYLKGFEIAGEDQRFYYAKATLDGNKVIVQNDKVANPVAVRYSWSNNPDGNLYNSAGLPASPFRTDNWKLISEGAKYDSWIGNRYNKVYKRP